MRRTTTHHKRMQGQELPIVRLHRAELLHVRIQDNGLLLQARIRAKARLHLVMGIRIVHSLLQRDRRERFPAGRRHTSMSAPGFVT